MKNYIKKKTLEKLNDKLLEILNDSGIIASYLLSPLSKITDTETENTSQCKLVKASNSNKVNDLLKQKPILVTSFVSLLKFRNTSKIFELKEDLLKMITINKHNLASLSDKNLLYEFAYEI